MNKKKFDHYPLDEGLKDLRRYYEAGTVPNALNGIIEAAGADADDAKDKLETKKLE